jgi:hypothetical protein
MIAKIFTSHPASVDETYFEHLVFALRFSGTLLVAAGAALVHALVPCLCQKISPHSSRTAGLVYKTAHDLKVIRV